MGIYPIHSHYVETNYSRLHQYLHTLIGGFTIAVVADADADAVVNVCLCLYCCVLFLSHANYKRAKN